MKIEKIGECTLRVGGQIADMRDSEVLREEIKKLVESCSEIEILMMESDTITSSIIGYLLKLVKREEKVVRLRVKSRHLYDLVKSMELDEVFSLGKIEE